MIGKLKDSLWPARDDRDGHFSVRPLMSDWIQDDDGTIGNERVGLASFDYSPDHLSIEGLSARTDSEAGGGVHGELKELLSSIGHAQGATAPANGSGHTPARSSLQSELARFDPSRHQPATGTQRPQPIKVADEAAVSTLLSKLPESLRGTYDRSIRRLEDRVYDLAGALTSLDGIELQLSRAREHLGALRAQGEPIDYHKVRNVLEEMASAVGAIVDEFDDGEFNLLGDARIRIAFSELGNDGTPSQDIDLNLISIEKLIRLSRKLDPDPAEIDRFVELLGRTLDSNIQLLSGVMLTLFAARDYTNSVTELAVETGVAGRVPDSRPSVSSPNLGASVSSRHAVHSGETCLLDRPNDRGSQTRPLSGTRVRPL